VQKEAIAAIVAGESPVVAVMLTGGGKSLLFMLLAVASIGRAEQNNCSCCPVNCVAGRHNAAVLVVRDIVCSIGGTPPA
jgi:superfamily II DNA helicase RecQ